MDKKGFTLVELLVVMTIIAILVSVGSFMYLGAIQKSRISTALSDVQKIRQAIEEYHADMGFYPPDACNGSDPGLVTNTVTADCSGNSIGANNIAILNANWHGPYLDAWPAQTPWGGEYDYDYWLASRNVSGIPGTCAASQPGVFISIRSQDTTANGPGFPPPDAEQYFRDQGHDTCATNNGVIYYLIKKL